MPYRFPFGPQPNSAHPALPIRLAVELLEDRLPPGSLVSAALPALLEAPAADANPEVRHQISRLDEPMTRAATWTAGAVSLAPAGQSLLTLSRAASPESDAQLQPVAGTTEPVAAQSSTDLPSPLASSELSLDRAPSEANLSALVAARITSGQGQDHSPVFGTAAAPVAAPDAGLPRSSAVTAPQAANPDHFGDQRADPLPVAFPDGSQGGDQTPPPPGHSAFRIGPNVRANSRDACSGGHGTIQSETAIAKSGRAVVVAYNDFRGFYCPQNGYQVTGWAYSLDNGRTFTDGGPLPGRQSLGGDPELATGPDGTFYLVSLWNPLSGMAVLRGTVNDTGTGINWSNPTVIQTSGEAYDKENIAVDQNTGTIYITYTRFGSQQGTIGLYVSHDGGLTFQGPTAVARVAGHTLQGSVPAVGPNGELYVAYDMDYPSDTGVGFVASYDGGQTFTDPVQISTTRGFSVPGTDRSPSFPHMAVDTSGGPYTGNIYVSWQSAIGVGNTGEAVVSTSQDGGATWSSPQVINNDGGQGIEWAPTVSVDSQGNLDSFFYSRRAHPGTMLTDLYFAQSTDGGQTFLPALTATSVSSTWRPNSDGTPAWGDYMNAITVGTKAYVAYADGRDGDPDAYVIHVTPKNR
jgi:hypothetical protein